ncbi:MAG: hypothetical protein ACI9N0_003211 [Ilumatobacter sp.]|jgi:uncharacterized protein YkwD
MKLNGIWSIALSATCAVAAIGFSGASIADAIGEPSVEPISHAAEFQQGGFRTAQRLETPAPRPTSPPAVVPAGPSAEVMAIFNLTNAERTSRGLSPLSLHPQLMQAAEAHFADQFRQGCLNLSHTGTDGSSPFDRIRSTGFNYRSAGENLACGYRTPESVMTGWMNSSHHMANIVNGSFTHIGIVAEPDASGRMYWVQVFGTSQ